MLPKTLGSIVIVYDGNLSISRCTRDYLFCFLDSNGLTSNVSYEALPLPGTDMHENPLCVPKPKKSSKGVNFILLIVELLL